MQFQDVQQTGERGRSRSARRPFGEDPVQGELVPAAVLGQSIL
jgi:hypothetical protein